MKNFSLSIFALILITAIGCKKSYVGDTFDFTNTTATYVELASKKDITAKQGSVIKVTTQMKTALSEDVTVSYTLTPTGGAPITGTAIILRNTVKTVVSITLPSGIVAPGSTTMAQLVLTGAKRGTEVLRIGSITPTSEVVNITITP